MPYFYEIDIFCIRVIFFPGHLPEMLQKMFFIKMFFTDYVEIKKAMSDLVKSLINVRTRFLSMHERLCFINYK